MSEQQEEEAYAKLEHVLPSMQKDAMDKLDDLFGGDAEEDEKDQGDRAK